MILFNFLELHEIILFYELLVESFKILYEILTGVWIKLSDEHQTPKVYYHVTEFLYLQ